MFKIKKKIKKVLAIGQPLLKLNLAHTIETWRQL